MMHVGPSRRSLLAGLALMPVARPARAKPVPFAADWMGALPDARRLSDLTIPGAHDAAARGVLPIACCQDLTIAGQLGAGIRFLDIRTAWSGGALRLFHGPLPLGLRLDHAVRDVCRRFLALHPRETIVLLLTNEDGADPIRFEAEIRKVLDGATSPWPARSMPTLGDVRGKLMVIRRFPINAGGPSLGLDATAWADDASFALATPGPASVRFLIQDRYIVPSVKAIDDKWRHVATLLERPAADGKEDEWRLNYCSGTSGRLFPRTLRQAEREQASSPPPVERPVPADVARGLDGTPGVQDRLLGWLRQHPRSGGVGTIMLDFAEPRVLSALLSTNFG